MTIPYFILRRGNMHILTFRLSIFGDFSQFTPTTANTIAWTQALQKAGYNYLPSIFQVPQQVVNMPFLSVQLGASDNRMQFVSPTGDTVIRILSERLDVELTQGVSDKPDAYLKDKLDLASKIMRLMLSTLGSELKGNRLAYYVDALIPEPTEKAFNSFYQKYNLGISMNGQEDECTEWNHRFNRRISKDVVLKIFALEEARSKNGTQDGQSSLIKRYNEETQFVMVDQWIRKGEINIDQLKDRQKEALLKWREKKNKAS